MFRVYRRCALNSFLVMQVCLFATLAARADEPVYRTVAILLPADSEAFADPVAIVFGGPPVSGGGGNVYIENTGNWGDYSNAELIPLQASMITHGGLGGEVYAVNGSIPSQHDGGVMLLGPNTDTVVELIGFTYLDGSILRWESIPENATGMIVIVTGRVR